MSLIHNVNAKCKKEIEENIDRFKQSLNSKGVMPEASWYEVLRYFEWLKDWNFIKQKMEDELSLSRSQKEQILRASRQHDCEFDFKTIEDHLEISDGEGNEEKEKFSRALKINKKRVMKAVEQRVNVFRKNEENQGFELHEGFNKMCGLRGSKLSGG